MTLTDDEGRLLMAAADYIKIFVQGFADNENQQTDPTAQAFAFGLRMWLDRYDNLFDPTQVRR